MGRFVKGDPRINRKGRPKTFDELRNLAQAIAHEVAKNGGQELEIDGHKVTVAEAILRRWASSPNPQLQKAFIETAFGKVPDDINIRGDITQPSITVYIPDNGRDNQTSA